MLGRLSAPPIADHDLPDRSSRALGRRRNDRRSPQGSSNQHVAPTNRRHPQQSIRPSHPNTSHTSSSVRNRLGNASGSTRGTTAHSRSQRHRPPRLVIAGPSNQSDSAIDVLRKLLEARWDPVTKLLDLANLAQDKFLKAAHIPAPGQKGAPTKTAGAIWKLCKEMYPNVRSISLADNNLRSLQPMSMSVLVATLPELANLSLAGNQLGSFSDLNALSTTTGGLGVNNTPKQGLSQLRELILTGNPVRLSAEQEGPAGLQQYLYEACRRFPTLQVLDGEAIDPAVKSSLPAMPVRQPLQSSSSVRSATSNSLPPDFVQPPMPLTTQAAFFSDASTSAFVAAFCLQFFTAFDEDRDRLMDVYATKASFSLCASPYIPVRAKQAGLTKNRPEMPAQQAPPWSDYIGMSRNNAKLKGPRLCDRLANGPAEIVQRLKTIPRTRHPLGGGAEQQKFVVDAWPMPGLVSESTSSNGAVIFLTVHGEFQEVPSMVVRSFDRTFVLGAAGPASAAALKGWPCVVLTDQLTVRGYSSPTAWSTEPPALPTQPPSTDLTPDQHTLLNRLMNTTKLTHQYSLECLTQNGWEFDRAIKNFEQLMLAGVLPPDAFF